jgi:hypothetical protein
MPVGADVNPLEQAFGPAAGDGSIERGGGEDDYDGSYRGHKGEAWTDERGSTVPSLAPSRAAKEARLRELNGDGGHAVRRDVSEARLALEAASADGEWSWSSSGVEAVWRDDPVVKLNARAWRMSSDGAGGRCRGAKVGGRVALYRGLDQGQGCALQRRARGWRRSTSRVGARSTPATWPRAPGGER